MEWNAERYIGWNMDGMKNGTKMEMQMECGIEMQNGMWTAMLTGIENGKLLFDLAKKLCHVASKVPTELNT